MPTILLLNNDMKVVHSLCLKMPLQCACLILPFQFMKTLIAVQLLLKKPRNDAKNLNL